MKKLLIALALASATLALVACGGDDDNGNGNSRASDEAEIRAVIDLGNSWDTAVCDKLTDNDMENVIGGDRADCEQQVKQSPKDAVAVEEISVSGEKATVSAEVEGDPGQLSLVKDGGEWKLDDIERPE